MSDNHTLTYAGRVHPEPGTILGPGLDGRYWRTADVAYDHGADKTYVTVEEVAA